MRSRKGFYYGFILKMYFMKYFLPLVKVQVVANMITFHKLHQ